MSLTRAGFVAFALLFGCAQGTGGSDAGVRFAPGSDGGPSSSGACGTAGQPCCGGFCDEGLMCNPAVDVCEPTQCGAEGQDCCGEGPACQGTLTCLVSGVCAGFEGDAGPGSAGGCGMRGAACCASDPPCGSGLTCGTGGLCEDAPACGAVGQPCCSGSMCDATLACEGGTCRSPTPACLSDGAGCSADSACCNNSCQGGVCQTGGGTTMPPCGGYATCGTCTDTPHCMWCGGLCVDYVIGGKLLCAAYPDQC